MCERKTAACSVIFVDLRQAEELKAAAVGQDRPVPAHEAMQPAERLHHLLRGRSAR